MRILLKFTLAKPGNSLPLTSLPLTPIRQLHQSPPSPAPGDRARGKRRGFSPAAAVRQSQSATVGFSYNSLFFFLFPSFLFSSSCALAQSDLRANSTFLACLAGAKRTISVFCNKFWKEVVTGNFWKRSQSPVTSLTYSKIVTRMNGPKGVVGVIRGVVYTVDVRCLLWASSGIYGVGYLRAIGYFSMPQ